jgi:hypothetical protein
MKHIEKGSAPAREKAFKVSERIDQIETTELMPILRIAAIPMFGA